MKTLIIMRHAKSSWEQANLADHDRPLKKRGKRDAPRMGELLMDEDLIPDLIVSSSAKRAVATVEAVAEACDYSGDILVTRDLYHADSETFIEELQAVDDQASVVMVVGHNPGLEDFLEELTGDWHRLPTAAVAVVDLPVNKWGELSERTQGTLVNLWTPKSFTG
jgi:phosphohistidine phosphatase